VHSHSKGYHSIDVQLFHLMMFTLNQFSHWLVQLWAIILKELYKFFFSHYMGATYIRLGFLVLFKPWTTQIDFFSTFSRIHIQFFSLNISFPYHLNNILVSLLEAFENWFLQAFFFFLPFRLIKSKGFKKKLTLNVNNQRFLSFFFN